MRQFATADRTKITDIIYWGDIAVFSGFTDLGKNGSGLFEGCVNLDTLGTGKILANSGLKELLPEAKNMTSFCSKCR